MKKARTKAPPGLAKARTGIPGLDQVTGGGLPAGRPTLVCGGPGAGKTLLAMEFLVRGATELGEPGVFMAFEEDTGELAENFASLGHDLAALQKRKRLAVDFVRIERTDLAQSGPYDLDGLFVRLGHAIASVGAKRVALDTLEALFAGLDDTALLRSELRRLFRWLKDRGITAVITAERGDGALTRQGLEEYVADCVIVLEHRLDDNVATRRMRIVKYRGSAHGTNEYPFLIDQGGFSIMPVTALGLSHVVGTHRVSSGVPGLDAMLGGRGYYRGSSILVSGTAGSGKTSLAAHFARAAIARGERCLWLAFEESPSQLVRNMRSIGIDLEPGLRQGRLRIHAERPSTQGLEAHLVGLHRLVLEYRPQVVVVDPLTSFDALGRGADLKAMITRLIDFLKLEAVTSLFTSLAAGAAELETSPAGATGVSSLMDTWLILSDLPSGAERNRVMQVIKSRGMAHSNQMREFVLGRKGIELRDAYLGTSGALLTGAARLAQEAGELAQRVAREQETGRKRRDLETRRRAMEAQVAALRAGFDVERTEAGQLLTEDAERDAVLEADRERMARQRQADGGAARRRRQGHP